MLLDCGYLLVFCLDDLFFFLNNEFKLFNFCLMGKWRFFKLFLLGKKLIFEILDLISQLISVSFGGLKIRFELSGRLFNYLNLFIEGLDLGFRFFDKRYICLKLCLSCIYFFCLLFQLASKFFQFRSIVCKLCIKVFLRLLFSRNFLT